MMMNMWGRMAPSLVLAAGAITMSMMPAPRLFAEAADPAIQCAIFDYETGYEFDVTKVTNVLVEADTYKYSITPCGKNKNVVANPDSHPECGTACQVTIQNSDYTTIDIGNKAVGDSIEAIRGQCGKTPLGVKVRLVGGKACSSGLKRETLVSYFCHDEPEDRHVGPYEVAGNCAYEYQLFTKDACPTSKPKAVAVSKNKCRYEANGKVYDLSPLKKTQGNYVLRTHYDPDAGTGGSPVEYEFILNVCQDINANVDLTHLKADTCHGEDVHAGVCQRYVTTSDNERHFRLIGQTTNGDGTDVKLQRTNNGRLFLEYGRGDTYNSGAVANQARKVRIYFDCMKGAGVGVPEFLREDKTANAGTYYFSWTTEYACANHKSSAGSTKNGMGPGAVFALILFVFIPLFVVLYCLVGCFCNSQSGKKGMQMVPHIELLRSVCGFLPCCSSSSSAHKGLSISADGETQGGQSLLDDDYDEA